MCVTEIQSLLLFCNRPESSTIWSLKQHRLLCSARIGWTKCGVLLNGCVERNSPREPTKCWGSFQAHGHHEKHDGKMVLFNFEIQDFFSFVIYRVIWPNRETYSVSQNIPAYVMSNTEVLLLCISLSWTILKSPPTQFQMDPFSLFLTHKAGDNIIWIENWFLI